MIHGDDRDATGMMGSTPNRRNVLLGCGIHGGQSERPMAGRPRHLRAEGQYCKRFQSGFFFYRWLGPTQRLSAINR
jgi:hypothetical protein